MTHFLLACLENVSSDLQKIRVLIHVIGISDVCTFNISSTMPSLKLNFIVEKFGHGCLNFDIKN